MKVTRNNYEVWMIDYFDGKLNAAETAGLLQFLDANPDLKEEFELFDPKPVEAEEVRFPGKSVLKKQAIKSIGEISEENYEEYFIAFYEKDLEESQGKTLLAFLAQNPQLEKEFNLHASMRLIPDETIVYEQKESLHKKRRVAVYWWSGAVAAMLVILFGILSLLQNNNRVPSRNSSTFAISNLETLEISSIGLPDDLALVFESRPTPKITLPGTELLPAEVMQQKFTITKMLVANTNPALAKTDLNASLLLPENTQEQLLYAFAENTPQPEKKKSLLGKIIKNFAAKATENVPDVYEKPNKKDPTFLKVLDQSILVFNTITGSDTELTKSYDNDGNLRHYQIDGQSISWGKDISASPPNAE
jgi:hypothetical protein